MTSSLPHWINNWSCNTVLTKQADLSFFSRSSAHWFTTHLCSCLIEVYLQVIGTTFCRCRWWLFIVALVTPERGKQITGAFALEAIFVFVLSWQMYWAASDAKAPSCKRSSVPLLPSFNLRGQSGLCPSVERLSLLAGIVEDEKACMKLPPLPAFCDWVILV